VGLIGSSTTLSRTLWRSGASCCGWFLVKDAIENIAMMSMAIDSYELATWETDDIGEEIDTILIIIKYNL
jgi:hypothetical protein